MATIAISNRDYSLCPFNWSFLDTLYFGQTLLDICDVIFAEIKDIGIYLKKQMSQGFIKFNRIATDLSEINAILYCFSFINSMHLIIENQFIDKSNFLLSAANISMFISEILTPIYWLHDKGLLFLGRSADYIGRGIEAFEGASYLLCAISDVKTLIKGEWGERKIRAIVNLVWFFLWVIGKILENVLSPSHMVTALLTTLSLVRLGINLSDYIV